MKIPLQELRIVIANSQVLCTLCKVFKLNPDEQMYTTEILIKENNSRMKKEPAGAKGSKGGY